MKGKILPEVEASQLTLNKFFALYPFGVVMQPDVQFKETYDTLARFEKGTSDGDLTRTDTLSWQDKSWVVGVDVKGKARAYDWNDLKRLRIINDEIARTPIVVAIASDDQSFVVFERPSSGEFTVRNDSLIINLDVYDFAGRSPYLDTLKPIRAYQEFWHSWREFHPHTDKYVTTE